MKSEVIDYLESKVFNDEATTKEEELFQEYQWKGEKVFKEIQYRHLVRKLANEWNNS